MKTIGYLACALIVLALSSTTLAVIKPLYPHVASPPETIIVSTDERSDEVGATTWSPVQGYDHEAMEYSVPRHDLSSRPQVETDLKPQ